eukprot:COSAG02_NODE_12489_length_1537_cov_2.862309_1_plen_121_part_00
MWVWSFVIVVLQVMVAVGVFRGTYKPACETDGQCGDGRFCNAALGNRCDYCGEKGTFAMVQAGTCTSAGDEAQPWRTIKDESCVTYNVPSDPNFAGFKGIEHVCSNSTAAENVREWCTGW